MVKVTIDIGDCYWLAKPLTAIEKLVDEDSTNIDDVSALVNVAKDAVFQCNPVVPPFDNPELLNDTLGDVQKIQDKLSFFQEEVT